MNSIDSRPILLAGELFDELLVPLAKVRQETRAAPYFAAGPDPTVQTYFSPSAVTALAADDFEFPGGGDPDALVDALIGHWAAQGESVLADARAKLHAIVDALAESEIADDGTVDIFCYTLF